MRPSTLLCLALFSATLPSTLGCLADASTTGTEPEGEPSSSPEGEPSSSPEGEPSSSPEGEPSSSPEGEPTSSPEGEPSSSPEGEPSSSPEGEPSSSPEGEPDVFDVSELPCVVTSFDAQGALSSTLTYFFNNDRLEGFLFEYESEFVEDTRSTYVFDSEGRILRIDSDTGDDGTIDSVLEYNYVGDVLVSTLSTSMGSETLTRYEWDGAQISRFELDSGNDGTVDFVATYVYDGDGQLIEQANDNDGDGTFDAFTTFTYRVEGNVTTMSTDHGDDGTVDVEMRTTFNDAGWTLLIETVTLATSTTSTTTNQHDARGRVIRFDSATDGASTGHTLNDYSCHN